MRLETAEFIVTGCAWHYRAPRGLRASLKPAGQRNGMKSVSLTCRACSSSWVAMNGQGFGQFRTDLTAVSVTCPNGETKGDIALDSMW